jgi:predicted lipoprotein
MSGVKHKKLLYWIITLLGAGMFFYVFPLFRIVSLKERRAAEAQAAFNPVAFVESFWTDQLLVSTDTAVDVEVLLAALEKEPASARQQYSRKVGLSNTFYSFVRGKGTVSRKGDYELSLSIDGRDAVILIEAGPVFGNTVRDGSGLLDVNDFPNSQKFNMISAELNKRVEQVLDKLWQDVNAGDSISFLGCVEIPNTESSPAPLRIVPVIAEKQ